ncbi:MAG: M28 family peptidase [Promethearchaeota archaeon]|nr:MAG: M28 family peptidase [Candidatus Lokiarchaeota archaeon]
MNTEAPLNNHWYSKDRIYKNVQKFSFPRLVGSDGEKEAVKLTVDTFKEIGYTENEIIKEKFEFSDFYSTTLVKFIGIISLNALLVFVLAIYLNILFTFFIIGLMTLIVFLIIRGLKHPEEKGFWGEYFGKTIQATNVFVKLNAKSMPIEKAGNIIISAHLDSKSQTFKTAWRIISYRIWLFCGIILGGFYIASLLCYYCIVELNYLILQIGIWILTGLISFSNLLLIFLNTQNKSPGALDNASGMSIVFELSRFFKDNLLENFNIWFCQFSAEELGTMGSRIFVNNHEDQFIKGKIFQLNFDMVSAAKRKRGNRLEYLKSYGFIPRKKVAPILSKYLENAASEENVELHGFHITTGAHTDSVPFHLRSFSAVDISTKDAAFYTHSEIDTPDKVDPQILVEACIIARRVILMLDEDYKLLSEEHEIVC